MEEKKYKSDLEMVREGSILKEYNIKMRETNELFIQKKYDEAFAEVELL